MDQLDSGKASLSIGEVDCSQGTEACFGKRQVSNFKHARGRDGSYIEDLAQYLETQNKKTRKFLRDARIRTDQQRYLLTSGSAFSRAQSVAKAAVPNARRACRSAIGARDAIKHRGMRDDRVPPPPIPTIEASSSRVVPDAVEDESPSVPSCIQTALAASSCTALSHYHDNDTMSVASRELESGDDGFMVTESLDTSASLSSKMSLRSLEFSRDLE